MTAGSRWVLVATFVGAAIGYLFPDGAHATVFHASSLQVLSSLFLRLIKCLIAPLVFSTLVVGIAGHGDDIRRVGRLAFRSTLYFAFATTLALGFGFAAASLVKPGLGVSLSAATGTELAKAQPTFAGVLEHAVPQSFFDAAARNESLQITVFAILFAIGLTQVRGSAKQFLLMCCESLAEVMFKFIGIVMKVAPLGIGAAMAVTVGHSGLGALKNLRALVLTLYGALIAFALLVLLPIAISCKVPIRRFWQAVSEPWLIGFTTASSEAALPLALRNMEGIGVPGRVASFVLPTGYAFNLGGTTLYLALASLFVAQAAGVHLPLSQQILLMVTLLLTSKGLAGVPRSSLVVLSGALGQFGLPLSGVAVILGVDAFMDMARTSVNVLGNCLATVVMARWKGSFDAVLEEERPQTSKGGGMAVRAFVSVRPVAAHDIEKVVPVLVDLLRDTVNGGASLGFWAPLSEEVARDYWLSLRPELEEGSLILLTAYADGRLVGSAQLALACWPNAPHRAEVQKVLVAPGLRGQGVGRSLMAGLHGAAWQQGRSLLILNARHGPVGFYKRLGYQEVGVVPGYSVGPAGERYDTVTLYQQLAL
jgi:proton glutamate symport protein